MRSCTAPIAGLVVAAVLLLGQASPTAGELWGSQSRALLATKAKLNSKRLRSLGVPEGADILFQLASDCPQDLDSVVLARMGQQCFIISNMRKCLNISQDAPQFVFKGCTKADGCPSHFFGPEKTACILEGLGISVLENGDCEGCRCGIPPGNDHLFVEKASTSSRRIANVPHSNCFIAQPKKFNFTVQTVCTNGRPTSVNKWTFKFPKKANDKPYDCIISRRCIDGLVDEVTLCYQNGTASVVQELDSPEADTRGAGGCKSPGLISYSLPFLIIMGASFCTF
ncbi:unnamed protein product [Ostreobium quekettii]|uniref:Uncharacterized protein n=1 Tax=Ostreobium quekettii TaxID=121088 RepID=A0A8S1J0V4_9CHLO|nr:unnamed protein product [Ostreobium quekettii]|eukprot:evm.model.scf_662.5 EVM.evm.TU.scf_662.5   scf_662:58218-63730(+)